MKLNETKLTTGNYKLIKNNNFKRAIIAIVTAVGIGVGAGVTLKVYNDKNNYYTDENGIIWASEDDYQGYEETMESVESTNAVSSNVEELDPEKFYIDENGIIWVSKENHECYKEDFGKYVTEYYTEDSEVNGKTYTKEIPVYNFYKDLNETMKVR